MINCPRTIVVHLMSGFRPKVAAPSHALELACAKEHRLVEQSRLMKAKIGLPKLYSWHAPEVKCTNEGKSFRSYEFGGQVAIAIAMALNGNFVMGARSLPGNPPGGHMLSEEKEQVCALMQQTGVQPGEAYVGLGCCDVDKESPGKAIRHHGKNGSLTTKRINLRTGRQVVEPIIGHLKADHQMGRWYLKDGIGDRLNAVLRAAGHNLR